MRNLWTGTLLIAFVFGAPTTFNAAEEPEVRSIKPLTSEAIYLGLMMDDRALEQRTLRQRAQQTGAIDVYNVWPSEKRITMNNNLEIKGHQLRRLHQQWLDLLWPPDLLLPRFS